jgi:hypothetical protein
MMDWDEIYALVEKMENSLADINLHIPTLSNSDGMEEIRWFISDVDYELYRLKSYVKSQIGAGNGRS